MDTKIIIGVPGPWINHTDIVTSIVQRSGGYLFAGLVLMNTATKQVLKLEIHDHDPKLQEAFRLAAGGRIPSADLAAIAKHHHTLYCLSSGVSVETAQQMLKAGVGLLGAGGFAIKVESSGVAHSAGRWRELAASENIFDTYTAFVTLIGGRDCFYSCGMHNFGLPDAIVPRDLDPQSAAQLLNAFNHHLLAEQPSLTDGHTFSVAPNAPRFRLQKTACDTYEPEHAFHNPNGMWKFIRA